MAPVADPGTPDHAEAVLDRLAERYPPEATAGERDPFRSLVATIMSQRTDDDVTYPRAKALFEAYPDVDALAGAGVDEIRDLIEPVGFYNNKAEAIKQVAEAILEDHGGEVPRDRETLEALPMVGPKTSACVMCYGFGEDVIAVDTHVHRISNRLGWVDTDRPEETEAALRDLVPEDRWNVVNELLVRFGRDLCSPRSPSCEVCPVNELCPSADAERAGDPDEEREGGPTMLSRVSRVSE